MERINPDSVGDERSMLRQFLDYQRALVLYKSEDLSEEQARRCLATSTISVGGMLKHLTLVEDHWFDATFAGNSEREPWASIDWEKDPDWEWRTAADDPLEQLLANYLAAMDRANRIITESSDLDVLAATADRHGIRPSLRWVLLHMIEETARHVGHLDLLRESIDGQVGD